MPTKTSNSKSAWSAKDIYDMIFSTYGNAHVNANKARAKEASKYMIPYIPEKEIMLTTGRYNTGKISTNLLDSIYNASQRTGVPLDIALGLGGRESTLGIGRGFKKGKSVSGTDLYSNWQQIQTIPNNKAQMKRWNSLLGRTDLTDEDYDFKSEFLMRAQDSLENTKPLDENPIDNALKFYQTGKYNPGDSRHTQMVEDDAKALMSDPAIQKWLKTKTGTQMKCGGRRKAQLGLDIREGGIAIPIANNMFYIDGRKHAAGGVAIGPNNKNGVEVEGGEVVEMIDSNHPSVGRQFKAGGQQQTMRVFSSVPFLRGVSPAELVLGGANPDAVFKAQEEYKDRNRINDDGTIYKSGGIHIKPSKRGTFTAAATKHGMGVQEFASKVLANKEPKSGFGRVPQQTTIEYTPKGESISAYDASVEFHKRISDMLYDSYVKKYGKKGVDKAMKREHISKYEYGGRIKAEGGKFLKYKNGIFTDPETGEEYDVDPEVFKMYGNTKESGVIPTDDYTKGTFNARPQYYAKKRLPIAGSQSIAEKAGLSRSGWSYGENPTFNYVPNINISVPTNYAKAVGDNTKKSTSSTARGEGNKASTPKAAAKSTPTIQDTVNKITTDAWKASKTPKIKIDESKMPSYNVSDLGSKESKTAKAKLNTSPTWGVKEAPWVPQYNLINTRDWIGVGTNLAGHIASYFANNALLKKAPMPIKPVQFQAAKLKTTHNINPDLANINEVTQMNLAEVGRNTASSNTSLARKQRIMNEARDARNKLYGQKENIETQLINLDRRNRQDVYNRNIAAYNDWLDKTYVAKSNNLVEKQRNLNNLISGIPMAVNTMLGTIESRKSTNDMIKAMSASRPNVDGRLLGIGDYYSQKLPDGRTAIYNKNHKLVKYV